MSPYIWGIIGCLCIIAPITIAEIMTGGNDTQHLTLIFGFAGMAITQVVGLAASHKTDVFGKNS